MWTGTTICPKQICSLSSEKINKSKCESTDYNNDGIQFRNVQMTQRGTYQNAEPMTMQRN